VRRGHRGDPARRRGARAWRADLDGLVAEVEGDGRTGLAAATGLPAGVVEALVERMLTAGLVVETDTTLASAQRDLGPAEVAAALAPTSG